MRLLVENDDDYDYVTSRVDAKVAITVSKTMHQIIGHNHHKDAYY